MAIDTAAAPLLSTTQVALVEDDTGMRERLARVIDADPSLTLAHCASTATELLAWLEDNPVDVLLVDLGLPDIPGLQVIDRCRAITGDIGEPPARRWRMWAARSRSVPSLSR